MDIKWAPAYGYEGLYEASTTGEVRSTDRWVTNRLGTRKFYRARILKPSTSRLGYKRVNLHLQDGSPPKTRTVHSIVLESFVSPRPPGAFGCHGNGDPGDNRLENLRWATPSENMYDKAVHGTDHQRNKDLCPRNHRLEEPNLKASKKVHGWRGCRACHQAKSDDYNGSSLRYEQLADMRYFMIHHGLSFSHGQRQKTEIEMHRRAEEWLNTRSR